MGKRNNKFVFVSIFVSEIDITIDMGDSERLIHRSYRSFLEVPFVYVIQSEDIFRTRKKPKKSKLFLSVHFVQQGSLRNIYL